LLEALNRAIAKELKVSIQYMWQHVQVIGVYRPDLRDAFKKIAMEEMKQAEKLAERLFYLGGKPTTQPDPVTVGENVKEMLQYDIGVEGEAIRMYKDMIRLAESERDYATRELLENILVEEEEEHSTLTRLLKTVA